jgi:hypothetical protein
MDAIHSGGLVSLEPIERYPQQLDCEKREKVVKRLFGMLFGSFRDAIKSTEHSDFAAEYGEWYDLFA